MRKVITGEQAAQLYNRDPFALPAWRAPIYQTPGWIIAAVQLARLIARIIRLVARHPVAAAVLALLAFIWASLSWPGVAALAACAAVLLVT
jgi:S-DNA-T family DNA segregation ATPase FtsK/SpoIIIE